MTRILTILFLALLLTATTTAAKTLNKVAAIVNDEIITTYQLDKAVVAALAKIANQNQLTAAEFDNIKTQAMQKLVNDKLLQQRIKELDIKVFAAEIESAVEDVQRRNNLSREMLEEALVTQGMSMAKYKQQIEDDILRHRLLGQEVKYKIMVTSRDVRSYFDQHRDEYDTEPKVRLNRLTFVV
ncbi:MAG: SurA N-terminal domain-containing protein, partial [Desulfuromonadales bacterium]|nr:SurA N-terminal domain-containing protein [Desulfuromonadales bacterium]